MHTHARTLRAQALQISAVLELCTEVQAVLRYMYISRCRDVRWQRLLTTASTSQAPPGTAGVIFTQFGCHDTVTGLYGQRLQPSGASIHSTAAESDSRSKDTGAAMAL